MIALDIAMVVLLSWLVFRRYRRTKILLLPSNSWLVSVFIFSMYLAYLVSTEPESLANIGQSNHALSMQWAVDELLIVCTVGVVSCLLSYWLVPRIMPTLMSKVAKRATPTRLSLSDLTIGACMCSLIGVAFVWSYFIVIGDVPMFSSDVELARSVAGLSNPARYLYTGGFTLANVGLVFLLSGLALRKIRHYRSLSLIVCLAVAFTNFVTASRGNFLTPLVGAVGIYFMIENKKLTIPRALMLVVCVLLAASLLRFVRAQTVPSWSGLVEEVEHGNTFFANFRDTGWVLMCFEAGRYPLFYGKTLLAGHLGFIPSSILPFRQQYTWGAMTHEVVDIRDPMHFGLGHVYFGDWYINFGYIGVVVEGLLIGAFIRFLDERLLHIRSAMGTASGYNYLSLFKLWFWASVVGLGFTSAGAVLVYPNLLGYFGLLAFGRLAYRMSLKLPLSRHADAGVAARAARSLKLSPKLD
jgi:oligosaccharide repeat unit polymerase